MNESAHTIHTHNSNHKPIIKSHFANRSIDWFKIDIQYKILFCCCTEKKIHSTYKKKSTTEIIYSIIIIMMNEWKLKSRLFAFLSGTHFFFLFVNSNRYLCGELVIFGNKTTTISDHIIAVVVGQSSNLVNNA